MIRSTATKVWVAVLCLSLAGALGCRKSSSLITTAVTEPAGDNCPAGGLAVRTGDDVDNDDVVSEAEAVTTHYVCNGVSGTPGTTGVTSLNKVTPESPGTNCDLGGYLLESGRDANGNDVLDGDEVTSSEYLCTLESPANDLVLLNKTFVGSADTVCPGGYVRIGYGVDADGDGMLSSTEQTSSFVTCNLLPRLTSGTRLVVPDCTQTPIALPITSTDLDGRVAQTSVQVLASGSALVFSSGPNGEVRLSPGAHVAGALIEVTLTDDLGAVSKTNVRLVFSGTGCTPLASFHGVFPETCVAIEIGETAGDDRGGPVFTGQYVYYNGDDGILRTGPDLENPVVLVDSPVDYLMGDPAEGRLLSLWSSEWDAVLPDGGAGAGITSLFDASDAGTRFEELFSPEPFDQIVVLDETTLQPTARFALPQPINGPASFFDVTASDGGVVNFPMNRVMLAAGDGQALVARAGSAQGQSGFLYQLIDSMTGAVTLTREVVLGAGDPTIDQHQWLAQEDMPQHYALHKRGTEYVLTYLSYEGWMELELSAGQPQPLSYTFAGHCDVQNLALGPNLSTVYFHSEYGCFGYPTNESLLRCDTLYGPNLNGDIDDRGTTIIPEGPR